MRYALPLVLAMCLGCGPVFAQGASDATSPRPTQLQPQSDLPPLQPQQPQQPQQSQQGQQPSQDQQQGQQATKPEVTRNGDWFVACTEVQVDGKPEKVCEMQQTLEKSDTGQAFIRLAIGYPRNSKKPVLRIFTPLGVMLQEGLGMQIDNGKAIRLPYQVCLPQPAACLVQGTMEDDIVNAMKRGSGGTLSLTLVGNQDVNAPFSLNGFTVSINALK
jgi:invasion protein IalB